MVFISHSLPVVAEVADREVVLYAGEVVEEGRTAAVFARPRHPYTATLLRSAPDESGRPPRPIEGTVPPPHDLPPGCVFGHPLRPEDPRLRGRPPPLFAIGEARCSRCIRWREL